MKPEEMESKGMRVPTIGEQLAGWLAANEDFVPPVTAPLSVRPTVQPRVTEGNGGESDSAIPDSPPPPAA